MKNPPLGRGWKSAPLGEVADFVREAVSPSNIRSGTLYVGLEHIDESGAFTNVRPVKNGELASNKFEFGAGHILYGKLRPYLRKIARPNFSGVCSTDILPIKPKAFMNRDYLFHCLRQPSMIELASVRVSGVNLPRVSPTTLAAFEIVYPSSPDEQQRIAAILDKADAIRRNRQETTTLTEELLRSTFLEMFGDPLRNPRGWPTMTIGEIAPQPGQIVDGPFGSTLKPDCYVGCGVRVIRNFNIHDGWFDDSDFRYVTPEKYLEIRRSEVRPGDILISTKGTVGDVCRMPNLPGESVLSATGTVRIRVASLEWEPDFIVHQMILPSFKTYVRRRQTGSIQKYLNLSAIRRFSLIKPPVELQKSFVELAGCTRQLRARMELHQSESAELFNSLVQRAFGGEL